MYSPDYGPLGTKLSRVLSRYNETIKYDAPKMSSQLTSKEWLERMNEHKQRTFSKYQKEAIAVKNEYLDAKNSIDRKKQSILYPRSSGYNEAEKHTALLERSLAIQQMQGSIDKNAMLKMIDDDFANGNVDKNGEVYSYLLTHNLNNLETQLTIISKLKEVFNARGLTAVNELKRDVDTAADEFHELQTTFGV